MGRAERLGTLAVGRRTGPARLRPGRPGGRHRPAILAQVQQVYDREGKLVEKYDISGNQGGGGGGEYPLQDGFGWSNGVTLQLLRLYGPGAGR